MTTSATATLVEFLLADDSRAERAARLLSSESAWTEALALASAWKAIPNVFARLQSLGIELPPANTGTLRREFLKTGGRSAFVASKAIPAIHALEQAGIPVVVFKGIATMALFYADPKSRAIQDADLLICEADLHRALECLEQQGFVREGTETLGEYVQFVTNSPGFAGNKAVALHGEGAAEIDLHWELAGANLSAAEILERASRARLMGVDLPVVAATDGFLLTIHHAIRENLAIENVCRDLLDTGKWCQYLAQSNLAEEALRHIVAKQYQIRALGVLSILEGYDPTTYAAQLRAGLAELSTASERRSARRLVELFHYQLGKGRLGKDVFYLVHSRPWRQILRGLRTDWSGYRRSMKTIEAKLGEQMPVYARVAMLAKSMPGMRGLRLARELARVKYGAS